MHPEDMQTLGLGMPAHICNKQSQRYTGIDNRNNSCMFWGSSAELPGTLDQMKMMKVHEAMDFHEMRSKCLVLLYRK